MERRAHWDQVYQTKNPEQVSWYQANPVLSRGLIERAVPARDARIIDVGAGASALVDALLVAGYRRLTVADISDEALRIARARVDARFPLVGESVAWRAGDVLTMPFASGSVDVWHDRAVFHFLVDADDRARYIAQVRQAVRPGGTVLVATFAADGPSRCSGLDVCRYSPELLHGTFGDDFALVDSRREVHRTPSGAEQAFTWCVCRYQPQVVRHAA